MRECGEESQFVALEHADLHEPERRLLFDTFRQPQGKNKQCPLLILISGPSGCGKTTLAKTLKSHVEQQEGMFLSGKIDQFHQSNPVLGVVSHCVASIKNDVKFQARLQDDLRLDLEVLVESMPMLREIFPCADDGMEV